MKRFLTVCVVTLLFTQSAFSADISSLYKLNFLKNDKREIQSVLNSQVRYANRTNFDKFISTYDKNYKNSDGFDLDTYANLVKDIWKTYDKIKYGIKIKDIEIDGENATVELVETSKANIPLSKTVNGELKSVANSIYYLKKLDGKWKVVSDSVIDENTSMLYGEAMNLDIKLTAPKEIQPGVEYTASLEFEPPVGTMAIASIAKDKIEYPQKQAKEVFRRMPEDNILERLFISNKDKANEYIIASIGLTKTDICDLSIKVSLSGFGYKIIRVNVTDTEGDNVKEK